MALSDSEIRNATAKSNAYKLFDTAGLFMIVRPSGTKSWRFRYRHLGRQIDLSLGTYPTTSLKDARRKRSEARRRLEDGVDPLEDRRDAERAARLSATNTFGAIAEEFLEKNEADDFAPRTKAKIRWLAGFLTSELGPRPLEGIKPFDVLSVLKKIERRGHHETANRARALAARIFHYGIITGRCDYNPAADLAEALITPKVRAPNSRLTYSFRLQTRFILSSDEHEFVCRMYAPATLWFEATPQDSERVNDCETAGFRD